MSKNLQFLDDPDDVPFINEDLTLWVSVEGNDETNSGSSDSPFRSLGKAVDVVRNKQIGKNNKVTIQLGSSKTDRKGFISKKYFEEEQIDIDFDVAKRLKIKGTKPTDHEVVAISYFDKAQDRDGYYCQILVTNQDKINIGDYLSVYDHLILKKQNPSYYWIRNNIKASATRSINPGSCYVESIRGKMIVGVHEVVDVSPTIEHIENHSTTKTEIFYPEGLKVGAVTLHIKSDNHTYKRLEQVPFFNTLGTQNGKPLFTYAAGAGNSPNQARGNNIIPPIFYGADMLSNPDTLESNGYEQFYYASAVQQIEIVDIMVRGFRFTLTPLDGKVIDPRTRVEAKSATVLWNDKTLTGYNRVIVANRIATYFYKKMIDDLGIENDLPFYFGNSSDPFITVDAITNAAKKVRDYLLSGASTIEGVPSWDEDNHPGYGFGPFESGAVRDPIRGGAPTDTSSYPSDYADPNRFSVLLRYYNLYPPVNGQLYQPTLLKRIRSWYNDNGAANGAQLDRWAKKGNQSPFFCGYITPQGWYKHKFASTPEGKNGSYIPSLVNLSDLGGYHRLFGQAAPKYVGNSETKFNSVLDGASGAFSNERTASKNLVWLDVQSYEITSGLAVSTEIPSGYTLSNRGSMGSVWYIGSINSFASGDIINGAGPSEDGTIKPPGSGVDPSAMGNFILDRYSFGYERDTEIPPSDSATTKNDSLLSSENLAKNVDFMYGDQTINLRAKCHKSVLRFNKNGICVKSKTKLAILKDICLVSINETPQERFYGLLADGESVVNASNIAVSSFGCGISARNQSLINLLADLGASTDPYNGDFFSPIDPGAVVAACGIGIESTIKSHINARRTVSSGSKKANYLTIANSSMDCYNSLSCGGFSHGYVCEFNSYMKATNTFSLFNGGIGYCCANNGILVCHRSRSIWNGGHGVLAKSRATIKAYEFISRSNDGEGFLAQQKSVIFAGANSSRWANWRNELIKASEGLGSNLIRDYYGIYSALPPNLFQVTVFGPEGTGHLPRAAATVNNNPTHGLHLFYHECNSTIAELNAGSGFAAETDSTIVADNTISRYNSKKYGEFFIYGWSGTRGSFPTDSFVPTEEF